MRLATEKYSFKGKFFRSLNEGWRRASPMVYRASVEEITSRTPSTRWNEPSTTKEINIPAAGVLIHDGIPTRDAAAEIPADCSEVGN